MAMKEEGNIITCDCGFSFQRGRSGHHECDKGLRQQIAKLTAALEAKDARAAACVNAFEGIETDRIAGKTLGEFLAGEVRLNKAEPKQDGSFGFTFSGFAIQMMAEAFAEQFKAAGAVNYLELLFQHDDLGPLTVTMQRVEGLTPTQKLAAAEQRLQQPALADVIAERQRQISAEGWTPEHDDEHDNNELAFAAGCYAIYAGATKRRFPDGEYAPPEWPWNANFWKPSTVRRDLVKAGALILAEIERLDRAATGVADEL
ncbi:hypothetical protein H8I91_25020 [Serratia fonticola]|uniref:hypothetical protein n=1 Tax=Serratia fonticola TaxID=47917 RepID=UPI0016480335|nr:hypothetical protein [Serratia fonticola]MBC3253532.1 hypothetical protein [Serratia fonticola]